MNVEDRESLSRIVELLETQNELQGESNQLLGEVLSALDELKNREPARGAPSAVSAAPVPTPVKIPNPGFDDVDPEALVRAVGGFEDSVVSMSVFWPKTRTRHGWARVSIQHRDLENLAARVAKGCLCGKDIVVRKTETDEFLTCEGVAKGGCEHRPAVYGDKLTFLTNIPLRKV
jgi:hypothetical protein